MRYAALFCCDLNFAHRAFWAAAILLRAAADMVRRAFGCDTWLFAVLFTFCHRRFCARLMRLRPAADIVPLRAVELLPFTFPKADIAASSC